MKKPAPKVKNVSPTAPNKTSSQKSQLPNNDQAKEFAEKPPLIPQKTKKKIVVFGSLFFAITIILGLTLGILSSYIKKQIQKPVPPQKPPVEKEVTQNVEKPVPRKFAYIKDDEILLTANINGEDRTRVLELIGNNFKLTTLYWKDKRKITYAKCSSLAEKNDKPCEISTVDIQDKSISQELADTGVTYVHKLAFSPDHNYLAYIGSKSGQTYFIFRSGTISTTLESFPTGNSLADPENRVFFTPDNQYIVFSTKKGIISTKQDYSGERRTTKRTIPIIYVYRINGIKVDEINGASDPFWIENQKIGYAKNGNITYRKIGDPEETIVTYFNNSYNPVLSPDKTKIAYWKNEGGFQDVVLGVYESEKNIHRNIVRGVVLPTWIDNDGVIGITADKCVGQNCFLYQFQTTSLVLININEGLVATIDQGKTISDLTFN